MKNVSLIAIALMLASGLFAQNDNKQTKEVPAVVKTAFAKQFPGAEDVDWEKEGNDYEAEFELNKVETSATFTADGHWKETETEIAVSALPANAQEYLKAKYSEYTVKEAAKIVDNKNVVTYEAELKRKGESMDVIFDASGAFLKIIKD